MKGVPTFCLRLLVLLALFPGGAWAQRASQQAVNQAVDRGVEYLLKTQQLDGTWNYQGQPRVGCTALILYTLLSSGVDRRSPAIELAATHLEREPLPNRTYDRALMLMALCAHDPERHENRIQDLVNDLTASEERGGWGYSGTSGNEREGWQDLSNTQYAVLGLWAAAKAGARVPKGIWSPVAKGVIGYQNNNGGFGYRKQSKDSTGSMTAAGISVLAICRDHMGLDEDNRRRDKLGILDAIEKGADWLGGRFSVSTNPGAGGNLAYYLYGLERAGALLPATEFKGHDWYEEGARHLVAIQSPAGHWRSSLGFGLHQTCFALLFLRKATAPRTGLASAGGARGVGGREVSLVAGLSPVHLTASGLTPTSMWINGFSRDVLATGEWPGEEGKGLRIERVIWLTDGIEGVRIEGDPSRPAGGERFPWQFEFTEPGDHQITAQVHILKPSGRDASGRLVPAVLRILRSGALTVTVDNICPEWMLENARDRSRNLLVGQTAEVRTSSSSGQHPGRLLLDNAQGTSWVADADDQEPTVTIELASPLSANTVIIGHARTQPLRPGTYARALEVQITVNETHTYRLRMHSDERRKGRLRLPGTRKIRSLEISIPWRVPGQWGSEQVGIAEVELQLAR